MVTRDQYNTQRQELLQSIEQSNLSTENQAKLREEVPPAANEATADADLESSTRTLKTLAGKLKKLERQGKKQDPALKGGLDGNGPGKLIPEDMVQQVQEREKQAAQVKIIEAEDDDLMVEKVKAPELILRKTFDEIWDLQGKMPPGERKNQNQLQRLTEAEAQKHLAHCRKFIEVRDENRRKQLQEDVKREVEQLTKDLRDNHKGLTAEVASIRAELTTQANKMGETRDDVEAFRTATNSRFDGLDKALNELREQMTRLATQPAAPPPVAATPPTTRRSYAGLIGLAATIIIAAAVLVAVMVATGNFDFGLTASVPIPSEPMIVLDENMKLLIEKNNELKQMLQQH